MAVLLILFHDSPCKYMLKAVFPFAAESSVQQPWLLCSYLTFSIDASHPSPRLPPTPPDQLKNRKLSISRKFVHLCAMLAVQAAQCR